MNASSPFNLHEILSIRCSVTEPLFCQDCESCKLLNKINLTKAWFIPLSHNNKKCFLERLILSSSDILPKLPNILISLQSKDYRYAKSRLHPSILDDGIPNNSDHSVNLEQIQDLMNDEYILWYEESTEWLRTNYLLSLLKLCSASLLYLIKDFAVALLKKSNDTVTEINVHSSYQITDDTQLSKIPKCKSAPILRSKSVLKNDNMKMRDIHSAKERITFMDEQSIYKNPINVIETIPYSFYRPSSQYSKMSSKTQFNFMQNTSARCTPILSSHRNLETPLSFCNTFTEDADSEHTGMDLIRLLPVQITKKIFGYLNEKTLTMISDVSEHWRDIAEQVMAELILVQFAKEDVMVIQAASAKVPHPCYARYVPVHVPVINKDGTLEINLEGKHINVVTEYDEFQDINMEECFNDFETQEVFMEERNVYCSSYNVLVLDSRKDRHRHIHYGCGKYVIVGSVDRKLNLLNVETAQHIRSIPGHAGSIKCLCLDESSNIVASGGYDTSVRHKGSIVSLFIFKNFVVSSATDKAVKVWNLTSGKCKRTFPNPSIVRALAINDVMLVTGCEEGKINIWDIESSVITKTLDHHTKLVTCVKFTKHHIFSASLDCFAMLWSNIGDLKKPLKMYRHPREVLCLDVLYCRLITACSDGKIRVWNMLNGECLRVIRGNSKDDAITSLFCSNERFVVNTLNCILVYNFEKVELDYTAPRERRETSATNFLKASPAKKHSHAHTRAMKLLYHGSPIHQQNNNSNFHFIKSNHRTVESSLSSTLSGKINRVRSAPALSRAGVIEPTSSSILRHITRVKSANAVTKMTGKNKYRVVTDSNSFPHSSTTPWEGTVAIELSKKSLGALKLKSSEKPRTQTRCRSAPVYLAKTLPLTISGFTTSSFQYNELPSNKMASKKQPEAQTSTRLSSRVGSNNLNNVKIKTSRLQLGYEKKLKKN